MITKTSRKLYMLSIFTITLVSVVLFCFPQTIRKCAPDVILNSRVISTNPTHKNHIKIPVFFNLIRKLKVIHVFSPTDFILIHKSSLEEPRDHVYIHSSSEDVESIIHTVNDHVNKTRDRVNTGVFWGHR